jgi:hypothetical protein
MNRVAFGTAGLILLLTSSAGAFVSAGSDDSSVNRLLAANISPAIAPADPLTNDQLLVVDDRAHNSAYFSSGNAESMLRTNHGSAESSGSPAETQGVPTPRAGWISFFGLLGVIAARHYGLVRRRRLMAG